MIIKLYFWTWLTWTFNDVCYHMSLFSFLSIKVLDFLFLIFFDSLEFIGFILMTVRITILYKIVLVKICKRYKCSLSLF